MPKYTAEYIRKARNAAPLLGEPGCTEMRAALDEIERLRTALDGAAPLLDLLREFHYDGLLADCYGFTFEKSESLPLEEAVLAWEAAGYPGAPDEGERAQ